LTKVDEEVLNVNQSRHSHLCELELDRQPEMFTGRVSDGKIERYKQYNGGEDYLVIHSLTFSK
jgi:hypothetical protein